LSALNWATWFVNRSAAGPAKACQTWMVTPCNAAGSTPTVGSGVGVRLGAGLGLGLGLTVGFAAMLVLEVGEPVPQAEKASMASRDRASSRGNRIILLESNERNRCQGNQEDDQHQHGQGFAPWIELGDLVKRFGVGTTQQEDK